MITLYGIPNCDTVKRARAWLAAQGVDFHFHDFKKAGVPAAALDRWLAGPWGERVLNRQGLSWRKLDEAQRGQAQAPAGLRALLLDHPSLIKRPVVEWAEGHMSIGFEPAQWPQHLAAAALSRPAHAEGR